MLMIKNDIYIEHFQDRPCSMCISSQNISLKPTQRKNKKDTNNLADYTMPINPTRCCLSMSVEGLYNLWGGMLVKYYKNHVWRQ